MHLTLGRGATRTFPYQYVQQAFDAGLSERDRSLDNALVYLSGAPIMMEVVADKLLRLGLPREHLLTNI